MTRDLPAKSVRKRQEQQCRSEAEQSVWLALARVFGELFLKRQLLVLLPAAYSPRLPALKRSARTRCTPDV